jgi:hypothetical protein
MTKQFNWLYYKDINVQHRIYMGHALWKGVLMHMRKVSSQISLCRDETLRLNWIFAKMKLSLNEKYRKAESVVPVRTAKANRGRHFTHMH